MLWCHTVILLAGMAAESMVYGKTWSKGASLDLFSARSCAELLCSKGVPPPPPWAPQWSGPVLPFAQIYVPPLSTQEQAVLELSYRYARSLLTRRDVEFYRLVSLLLHRRTMAGCEVGAVLGPRPRRRGKYTFVTPRRPALAMEAP
jgi:hypothetical protein